MLQNLKIARLAPIVATALVIAFAAPASGEAPRRSGLADRLTPPTKLETPSVTSGLVLPPIVSEAKRRPLRRIKENSLRRLDPAVDVEAVQHVTDAEIELGFALFNRQRSVAKVYSNFADSPFDLQRSFSAIAVGAYGTTRAAALEEASLRGSLSKVIQTLNALDLDLNDRNAGSGFSSHSILWGQGRSRVRGRQHYLFATSYWNRLVQFFGTETRPVDFEGGRVDYRSERFDPWVQDVTDGLQISAMVDYDTRTRLATVFTTAVGGSWQNPVDIAPAEPGRFELLDQKHVLVPMLSFTGTFPYATGDGFQAFELPLARSDLALLVVAPDRGRFQDIQQSLSPTKLGEIVGALAPVATTLRLPEVQIESAVALNSGLDGPLSESGAFTEGAADFRAINGVGFLYLASIRQNTSVKITGAGVAAAGVASVVYRATRDEPDSNWGGLYGGSVLSSMDFCSDIPHWNPDLALARPFLFAVRDRATGTILYVGQVAHPGGTPVPPDWTTNPCVQISFLNTPPTAEFVGTFTAMSLDIAVDVIPVDPSATSALLGSSDGGAGQEVSPTVEP